MRKVITRLAVGVGILVVLVSVAGAIWVRQSTYQPDAAALASWERAQKGDGWYAFPPADGQAAALGVVFYTGGLVDSRAYAVMAEGLAAEADVLVVVPDVPLNLVILNPNLAEDTIADFPQVTRWIFGGHSLGATGAAIYADNHPDVAGLFFWAGGSWEPNDLSGTTIPIISIHGSDDGIYTESEWQGSKPYAPRTTEYVTIAGGNHSFFGNYGVQQNDTPGSVARERAQMAIIEATSNFIKGLKGISNGNPF